MYNLNAFKAAMYLSLKKEKYEIIDMIMWGNDVLIFVEMLYICIGMLYICIFFCKKKKLKQVIKQTSQWLK